MLPQVMRHAPLVGRLSSISSRHPPDLSSRPLSQRCGSWVGEPGPPRREVHAMAKRESGPPVLPRVHECWRVKSDARERQHRTSRTHGVGRGGAFVPIWSDRPAHLNALIRGHTPSRGADFRLYVRPMSSAIYGGSDIEGLITLCVCLSPRTRLDSRLPQGTVQSYKS